MNIFKLILLSLITLSLSYCSEDSNFRGKSDLNKTAASDTSNSTPQTDTQTFGNAEEGESAANQGEVATDDGESAANQGSVDTSTGEAELVQTMRVEIQFDGKVSFCVDFSKGEMALGSSSSRLPDSPLYVKFIVTTNGGEKVSEYRSSLSNPSAVHTIGGNWSKVLNAKVTASDPRRGGSPSWGIYSVENEGTKACFYGDDQQKWQSGQLSLKLAYDLEKSN